MRILLVVYILVTGLICGLLFWSNYSKSSKASNTKQNALQVGTNYHTQLGSLSDVGVLIFTGLLTVATVVQIGLWMDSNRTSMAALEASQNANAETKNANRIASGALDVAKTALKVAVESAEREDVRERGRIVVANILVANQGRTATFTFRNNGRSTVETKTLATVYHDIARNGPVTRNIRPLLLHEHSISANETLDIIIDTPAMYGKNGSDHFTAETELIYTTNEKRFVYHFAWFHLPAIGARKGIVDGTEFWEDITSTEYPNP